MGYLNCLLKMLLPKCDPVSSNFTLYRFASNSGLCNDYCHPIYVLSLFLIVKAKFILPT